ncbi:MAG: hypothetical protein K1X38_07730 [Microthrixaceae bacterium]|nr:hypothetical protein [Microthrixaceae bacterium]
MVERVPRIRRAPLPADAVIVVRADDLIEGSSRLQAEEFRRRYPGWDRWGLSGFFARNETDVEDLAADRLERFPVLRLYRPSVLEEVGFQIVPTFRTPHVTLAFGGDLDLWIDKLRTAEHVERTNPYHESD